MKETSRSADVAQLVARNLAKVQVAGSNPVVRSQVNGRMAERRGSGLQILPHGFKSRSDLHLWSQRGRRVKCRTSNEHKVRHDRKWTIGSAVEHHIDIVGVTGSIPVSSTISLTQWLAHFLSSWKSAADTKPRPTAIQITTTTFHPEVKPNAMPKTNAIEARNNSASLIVTSQDRCSKSTHGVVFTRFQFRPWRTQNH